MHYSSRLLTLMWIVPLAVLSACSSQAAKEQGANRADRGGMSSASASGFASAPGLAADAVSVTPSFNCEKATLKVELAVCANPRLARLDGELTRLYDKAGKTPGIDRGQLQRLQGGWLNKRNACAGVADAKACLIDAYAGRIADLRSSYAAVNDDAGMSLGPIVWHCAGKPDVVSTFFNDVAGGDDSFVYLKWSGKAAVLEQAVSASGARYEGRLGDGDYEFWTKGNETQFSVPGAVGVIVRRRTDETIYLDDGGFRGLAAPVGLRRTAMGGPHDPALVRGLIDGLLAPISFVISLFSDTVRIYAYPNIGRWYDLGFLIGLSAWGGGASTVTRYVYVDRRTGRTLDIENR